VQLERIATELKDELAGLSFGPPVSHVYNPLEYAWTTHREYLWRYAHPPREVLLIGMNPGPWGMAQTGVPFGEVSMVRDWLGVEGEVGRPDPEHEKRPVQGFQCHRSEVSGRRVWTWARSLFGDPDSFFSRFFVYNYCPLLFLEAGGRNRTPDRLTAAEKAPLFLACDRALRRSCRALQPALVVGVGAFAAARAETALDGEGFAVGKVLHPSPASPAANRGWAEQVTAQLRSLGVDLPHSV